MTVRIMQRIPVGNEEVYVETQIFIMSEETELLKSLINKLFDNESLISIFCLYSEEIIFLGRVKNFNKKFRPDE